MLRRYTTCFILLFLMVFISKTVYTQELPRMNKKKLRNRLTEQIKQTDSLLIVIDQLNTELKDERFRRMVSENGERISSGMLENIKEEYFKSAGESKRLREQLDSLTYRLQLTMDSLSQLKMRLKRHSSISKDFSPVSLAVNPPLFLIGIKKLVFVQFNQSGAASPHRIYVDCSSRQKILLWTSILKEG